ncbi:hypothetical protein KKF32_01230 [Patescibacteria group bacterium]|nr:hypothetical protein [Patescibacteria group bacterium]
MDSWQAKYPNLIFGKKVMADGGIIIIDRPFPKESLEELADFSTVSGEKPILLDSKEMTKELEMLFSQLLRQLDGTLFIFPGNGSKEVMNLTTIHHNQPAVQVYAKRYWQPGSDPVSVVGEILPGRIIIPEVTSVTVVDDVISSGQTLVKLYERNRYKFSRADWFGLTWLLQIPRRKAKSGVNGYQKIITAVVAENSQKTMVPINSLSTLLDDQEIAKSFAERRLQKSGEFLNFLQRLRN